MGPELDMTLSFCLRIDKGSHGVICTLSLLSWIYVSYYSQYIHSYDY